jgi:hypothetical protein
MQAAIKPTKNNYNHLEPYNAPSKQVSLLSMPIQFLRHVVQQHDTSSQRAWEITSSPKALLSDTQNAHVHWLLLVKHWEVKLSTPRY